MTLQTTFNKPEAPTVMQLADTLPVSEPDASTRIHQKAQVQLLDCAERLATRLCRDAIWHGKHCNWIGPVMENINSQWTCVDKSLGPDMYSGTAGIALFLSEFHALRPMMPIKQTAEAALHHALDHSDKLLESTRAGYYCGLLGLVDVALRCASNFEQPEWVAAADRLIEELLVLGPNPGGVDVIMGSAGAIPALINLYHRTGKQTLLDLAHRHAELLLENAAHQSRGCSWDTLHTGGQHPHLTGYAHGTAGVALALAELYAINNDTRYKEAALAGFAYEQSHFSHEQQNWPDFRNLESMGISAEQTVCAVAWCHGSAGIGLSRLRAQHLLDCETLGDDANTAIATTRKQLDHYLSHTGFDFSYCHGVTGDLELLLQADRYLGHQHNEQYVRQVLLWAINGYEHAGKPWPCGVPDGGESPSLFLGTAGIGHFMLRAALPSVVSSVLVPNDN